METQKVNQQVLNELRRLKAFSKDGNLEHVSCDAEVIPFKKGALDYVCSAGKTALIAVPVVAALYFGYAVLYGANKNLDLAERNIQTMMYADDDNLPIFSERRE